MEAGNQAGSSMNSPSHEVCCVLFIFGQVFVNFLFPLLFCLPHRIEVTRGGFVWVLPSRPVSVRL